MGCLSRNMHPATRQSALGMIQVTVGLSVDLSLKLPRSQSSQASVESETNTAVHNRLKLFSGIKRSCANILVPNTTSQLQGVWLSPWLDRSGLLWQLIGNQKVILQVPMLSVISEWITTTHYSSSKVTVDSEYSF